LSSHPSPSQQNKKPFIRCEPDESEDEGEKRLPLKKEKREAEQKA